MTDDAGFNLSRLPQAVQEAVLYLLQGLVQEWPQPAAPPAFVVPPDPRGQLRRTILHVLRRHWFSVMGTVLPFEIITYAI